MKQLLFAILILISHTCFSQVTTTLDGSGSTDADGTIVGYKWTQISGPATAVFSSTTVVKPTVTFTVAGAYKFSLVVVDNEGSVSVGVEGVPTPSTDYVVVVNVGAANQKPKANAGPDQDIKLPGVSILNRNNGKIYSNLASISCMQ